MMVLRVFILAAFAGNLLAVPPSPGQEMSHPVAPGSTIRYADLLPQICPDFRMKADDPTAATASSHIGIREVGSNDSPASEDDEVELESVKTVAVLAQGTRVLIGFVLGEGSGNPGVRNLALFDLAPAPKLVDVVSVQGFPDESADYQSSLKLNETTGAYMFQAFHHNSEQGYGYYAVVFVSRDRILKLADILSLSCQLEGADQQSFEESVDISTLPDPQRDLRKVAIKVTLKYLADDPEGQHRPIRRASSHVYTGIYRWDDAKGQFVATLDEIKVVDAFNRKNN